MKKLTSVLAFSAITLVNSCSPLYKNLSSKYEGNFKKGKNEFYFNPQSKLSGTKNKYNIVEVNDKGDTIMYKTDREIYDLKKEDKQSFDLDKLRIKNKSLDTTIKDSSSKILYYHEGHLNWAFDFDRHPEGSKKIF